LKLGISFDPAQDMLLERKKSVLLIFFFTKKCVKFYSIICYQKYTIILENPERRFSKIIYA
jgi:hypothetical protein